MLYKWNFRLKDGTVVRGADKENIDRGWKKTYSLYEDQIESLFIELPNKLWAIKKGASPLFYYVAYDYDIMAQRGIQLIKVVHGEDVYYIDFYSGKIAHHKR